MRTLAHRTVESAPVRDECTSDSVRDGILGLPIVDLKYAVQDEDPNDAAFRPRREASIRARSVIANACGVGKSVIPARTPSRLVGTTRKEEDELNGFCSENLSKEFKKGFKTSTPAGSDAKAQNKPSDDFPLTSPLSDAPSVIPSTTNRNQKRPRQVLDCVLITSRKVTPKKQKLDSVPSQESNVLQPSAFHDGMEFEKIKTWKNPKVKKNEDLTLLPHTLRNRIRRIGFEIQDQYFGLDRLTREVMVTRKFISHEYGGSCQATKPKIAPKIVDVHGMNDFYFVNPEYDPHPPEVPGAPGLKLSTKSGPDKGRLRIMTKITNTNLKHNDQYLYVGQYDVMRADPPVLSVQEWKAQSSKFHNKWAQGIVTQGWGKGVRCRILGRRMYGREPTEEECESIQCSGRLKEVTEEEVKDAYFSGQEKMGVWTMKCVAYDNNFQRDLSEKFSRWVPQTKDKKNKLKKLKNDRDSDEEE